MEKEIAEKLAGEVSGIPYLYGYAFNTLDPIEPTWYVHVFDKSTQIGTNFHSEEVLRHWIGVWRSERTNP